MVVEHVASAMYYILLFYGGCFTVISTLYLLSILMKNVGTSIQDNMDTFINNFVYDLIDFYLEIRVSLDNFLETNSDNPFVIYLEKVLSYFKKNEYKNDDFDGLFMHPIHTKYIIYDIDSTKTYYTNNIFSSKYEDFEFGENEYDNEYIDIENFSDCVFIVSLYHPELSENKNYFTDNNISQPYTLNNEEYKEECMNKMRYRILNYEDVIYELYSDEENDTSGCNIENMLETTKTFEDNKRNIMDATIEFYTKDIDNNKEVIHEFSSIVQEQIDRNLKYYLSLFWTKGNYINNDFINFLFKKNFHEYVDIFYYRLSIITENFEQIELTNNNIYVIE